MFALLIIDWSLKTYVPIKGFTLQIRDLKGGDPPSTRTKLLVLPSQMPLGPSLRAEARAILEGGMSKYIFNIV